MNEIQPWFFIFMMLAVGFLCGYGWGKHASEIEIRKQKASLEANKIYVSVPVEEKLASEMFRLIGELVEKIQKMRNDS
jgi:hypothetical protein